MVDDEITLMDRAEYLFAYKRYFTCGLNRDAYINNAFYRAIEIIGILYGNHNNRNSNYHRGITYIAIRMQLSKSMIKSFRKKLYTLGYYYYRTPYKIVEIIELITSLLDNKKQETIVKEFLDTFTFKSYRDVLIHKQYMAIKTRIDSNMNVYSEKEEKIRKIGIDLDRCIIKVR